MKPILPLLPMALAGAFLLSGCPDTPMPKAPPKVPEPKAAIVQPQAQPAAAGFSVHAAA